MTSSQIENEENAKGAAVFGGTFVDGAASTGDREDVAADQAVGEDVVCEDDAGEPARGDREGKLYVCPTPIGNLGDITLRTLEALRDADVVCAEDTRVTGKLLAALGIEKRLERLDENTIGKRADAVAQRIAAGERIAYCSDAGMPGVSDPGMRLVSATRELGCEVDVLPGPTAFATAYVASGCTDTSFMFVGFFPRKDAQRREALESLRDLQAALIFYESPNRLADALSVIASVFPLRKVTVCRELTKLHEEVYRDDAPAVAQEFAKRAQEGRVKGEIVIVIDGPSAEEGAQAASNAAAQAEDRAAELAAEGEKGKQITKTLVAEFGIPKNEAYRLALDAVAAIKAERS